MVFSSPTFLFVFLPVTLLVIALIRTRRLQNAWLLAVSVVFYVWGSGAAVAILALVCLFSYAVGFVPWASLRADRRMVLSRTLLGLAIAVLLVPLIVYKYLPPFTAIATGGHGLPALVLPLGISFFTFHAISYVVDVWSGSVEHERNLRDFALYLFVFPHQIAGPIVRYSEIRVELKRFREATLPEYGYGVSRFAWGLAKKVVVADQCGRVADLIFASNASGHDLSMASSWLGALLYTLQIYFDFSGYSDMAIGLALLLGFRFPENFFQPYRAVSVTDFWRRWHMTLTRWFRDYVYIPLGGNRHGVLREYIAVLSVFFLTSLWHGGTWTFFIWGGMHSLALVLERITGLRRLKGWAIPRRIVLFVFIVVSWVPFRAGSVTALHHYWRSMISWDWSGLTPALLVAITPLLFLAVGIGMVSLFGPRNATGFGSLFGANNVGELSAFRWKIAIPVAVILLAASFVLVLWSDFSPFLYFQF